jgi:hypothetical protein
MKAILTSSLTLLCLTACNNVKSHEPQGHTQKPAFKSTTHQTIETKNNSPTPAQTPTPAPASAQPVTNTPANTVDNSNQTATVAIPERNTGPLAPTVNDDVVFPSIMDVSQKQQKEENTAPINRPANTGTVEAPKTETQVTEKKLAPSSDPTTNVLNVSEQENIRDLIKANFVSGDENDRIAIQVVNLTSNINAQDVKTEISGNVSSFNLKVSNKGTFISEVKNFKIDPNGINYYDASNGYRFMTICSGPGCEVLLASFIKFNDSQLLENYPSFIKLVKGSYVRAQFKQNYDDERTQYPDGARMQPQLRIFKLLAESVSQFGEAISKQFQEQVAEDAALAYSDHLIYDSRLTRGAYFEPKFSKVNGKLLVSAQLIHRNPDKPGFFHDLAKPDTIFKGEVKSEGTSDKIQADKNYSMVVSSLAKDKTYLVTLEQSEFKSDIKDVAKATQAFICQLYEEKGLFSKCAPIMTSQVFQDNVSEVSVKGSIKIPYAE